MPSRSLGRTTTPSGWREAAKGIGVAEADIPASSSRGKETFFDGKVFDPAAPEAYLKSLGIKRIA